MRKMILSAIIALMAIKSGLYAQMKETAQREPLPVQQQAGDIKLELVWEKEFEEGIIDVALHDDILMPRVVITGDDARWGCKGVYFFDKTGELLCSKELKGVVFDKFGKIINPWVEGGLARAVISRNGKYVGILEPKKFAEKEGNPIDEIEIIDSTGNVVNHFPVSSWYYWVSPYGDEIVVAYPIIDITIFTVVNEQGKNVVDLSKTSAPEYCLGNSLKAIGWRGSKKVEHLVAVYDSTLTSHSKQFAIPATSYGHTHSNYFLLLLPKINKLALSTRSGTIKLFNGAGKLERALVSPLGGGAIFSSPNNKYLHIPSGKNHILYDVKSGAELVRTDISPFHAVATESAELLILKEDTLYIVRKKRVNKSISDILQKKDDEEILFLRTNPHTNRLSIVTTFRVITVDIFQNGGRNE